eukprot:TRINITY_DN158_c0_g2_i1.p1 TRINITY_DN158_c0_g2~~TRINITY_DN158_c0_g2_i1.p1  ORF type:complete len:766 (-),score=246.79 TRINITY_DN158_c0_g2_i1:120-2177(-)
MKSIYVALKHDEKQLDVLEKKFWSVSDPDHPDYGNYLTRDEVSSLIAPPRENAEAVMQWLRSSGAVHVELLSSNDVIHARLSVEALSNAFETEFFSYRHHLHETKKIVRSHTKTAAPTHIASFVDLITGVHDFPPMMKKGEKKVRSFDDHGESVAVEADIAMTGPALQFVGSRGNAKAVEVVFSPVCSDGTPISGSQQSCTGPQWDLLTVRADNDIDITFPATVDAIRCGGSKALVCSVNVPVQPYVFYQDLHIDQHFTDGTNMTSSYPFPTVATTPILPQNIWEQYKIPPFTNVTDATFSQSVVEFEQQYYSPSDLDLFFKMMGIANSAPVTVVGPNHENNPGGEANLDIQAIMGVAVGTPTYFWSIQEESTIEIDDILTWCFQMGNFTGQVPVVNSLSYGMAERNVDKYLGEGYVARSNVEFKKMALQGISIIFATGDSGAGELCPPPMCVPNCDKLNPNWPTESPYVSGISTTYFTPLAEPICYLEPSQGGVDCTSPDMPLGEVGVSLDNGIFWSTGGGFSEVSTRPSYQEKFVQYYLETNEDLPPKGVWNPSGRAYPDFSAVGHNIMIALSGKFVPIDGTSASAPIFAGVVSLLNRARVEAGQPLLGFLNPLFYKIAAQHPSAFYDVTVGANKCGIFSAGGDIPSCCDFGYTAQPGWDAVTGLGTPNYEELVQMVLKFGQK